MANEFEFNLPNGQKVYTGNIVPEVMPLTFKPYPDERLRPFAEIAEIIRNPRRRKSKEMFKGTIMNQGRRSSCNPFMMAAMLSRMIFFQTGNWVKLAPEFAYMNINDGKDQGSMLDDGMIWMTDVGICRREINGQVEIPYESFNKNQISIEALRRATEDAGNYRSIECYQLPTSSVQKCWHAALSCIAGGGVCGFAVHVGDAYMRSGKVAGFNLGAGNHAVPGDDIEIVGAGTDVDDFQIVSPQSWGAGFADNGWTNLTIRHIEQPMKYHGIYGLRSASITKDQLSHTRIQ